VVLVGAIEERDQQSGVGDAGHGRVKPFRDDKSRGPRTAPANRMNDLVPPAARARSS
jgi:hypothetical protein